MRNYEAERDARVGWVKDVLRDTGAKGVIFGNSGGKDSALVGALCRMATENVLGVIMPCGSVQNYESDLADAEKLADTFKIPTLTVDLSDTRNTLLTALTRQEPIAPDAKNNINPRLRMATLYAIGQSKAYLVAGTGNKSEQYMGYFTKWGDGACDFNPIADLYPHEILEFLSFLGAPASIIQKAPSAGLFDGQTDEGEMGVSYDAIHQYLEKGIVNPADVVTIERAHQLTEHKRNPIRTFPG